MTETEHTQNLLQRIEFLMEAVAVELRVARMDRDADTELNAAQVAQWRSSGRREALNQIRSSMEAVENTRRLAMTLEEEE